MSNRWISSLCTRSAFLSVVVLSTASCPVAASPLIIEIQLPSDTVTLLLWDLLYTQEICSAGAFPFPTPGSPLAVLDRVTFPEQPHVVNADSSAAVVVRADVFLRAEECLRRSCGPNEFFSFDGRPADPLALELSYEFELTVDSETDPASPTAQLCLTLASLRDVETDLEMPAALLPPELRAALEGIACPTLPLETVQENLLGEFSTITQSGMSARPDGSRIGMRFEIDGPAADSADSWDRFRAGELAPTDASLDWSLFVDPRVLVNLVRNQIDHQLSCKENRRLERCHYDFDNDGVECPDETDDPKCDETIPFHRTSGPTASWSGGGSYGGGHIDIELAGEIPGGFSETPCLNTIHIDPVDIDVDLRIEPGIMNTHILIDPDPDDDDILVCTLAFPTLDVLTILTQVVVAIIADSFDPDPSHLGLQDCTQLADDEYECPRVFNFDDPLDLGGPTIGVLQLTHMIGRNEGAILGGSLQRMVRPPVFGPPPLPPFPQFPKAPLSVGQGLIVEGVQGGCSNMGWGYSGSFSIAGDGVLCQPLTLVDDPPARHVNYTAGPVCGEEQETCPDGRTPCPEDGSNCPVGVYAVIWPAADPRGADYIGNQVVEIRFPATTDQAAISGFFADPYDLAVLVRSSAGVQHHVVPAPAPPDLARRIQELSLAMSECEAPGFGFRLPHQALNMFWLPDPPPLEIELTVAYDGEPPIGEIHRAFLTDLSVTNLNTVVAEPWGRLNPRLSFPGAVLGFEGKVLFDFRSMGQVVVPFSLEYEHTLLMTDVQDGFEAELVMLGITILSAEVDYESLPTGIQSANGSFTLTPDMVVFQTQLLQVAGPADFDENGDVSAFDWRHMQNATSGPAKPTDFANTDFNGDAHSDLMDIQRFQNWFTGSVGTSRSSDSGDGY